MTALGMPRFKHQFLVVESCTLWVARIATSANIPVFGEGISDEYLIQ
ncbi:hypothetical protein ACD578_02625 [Microvirga sp. RSM25]